MKKMPDNPLILLFSPREKIRNIFTAGLLHSNYRVIEAATSYVAGIKANQYLPSLAIADITKDNIKDFLFLSRLERSARTQNISIILSVTKEVHEAIRKIHDEVLPLHSDMLENRIHILEYPYPFDKLVKKIEEILADKHNRLSEKEANREKEVILDGDCLFSTQLSMPQKMLLIESSGNKQWAFPFTIIRSLEIIGSEKSCCPDLAKCIEADPAATLAILSIANKIQYAGRYGRITNVLDAIVRIGFAETRNILALLTLIDISSDVHIKYGFKRSEFWMHSLATAVIAENLCRDSGFQRPELAFIAGLIHDIGKIPVDNNFTSVFRKLLEDTTNTISSFWATESKLMGFSHVDLGHYFTAKWHFPASICNALLYHHTPEKIMQTAQPQERLVQEAVFIANILAKALNFGHSCDEVMTTIPDQFLEDFNIPHGPEKTFIEKVYVILTKYYEFLKISISDFELHEIEQNSKDLTIAVFYGKEKRFHPLVLGLKSFGYPIAVKEMQQDHAREDFNEHGTVIIFIPDQSHPLDIMITDEIETDINSNSALKIFLLQGIKVKDCKRDLTQNNIILMDSDKVDLRLILHIIEDYYYTLTMD